MVIEPTKIVSWGFKWFNQQNNVEHVDWNHANMEMNVDLTSENGASSWDIINGDNSQPSHQVVPQVAG